MKRITIFFFAAASIMCASCSLDQLPLERMGPEQAFRDSVRVRMFVNELYNLSGTSGESTGFNRIGQSVDGGAMFDAVTDIAVYAPLDRNGAANLFTQGNINTAPGGYPDSQWAQFYARIRKSNIILTYIEHCESLSETRRNQYIGEAKMLQAYYYHELVRRFGAVPLVKGIPSLEEEINIPRNTFEECIDYIVQLCDEAKYLLPTRHSTNEYGRVTRGTALALKARALLHAASPLHNGSPITGSTRQQSYPTYDKERWRLAAEAALECIELRNPDMSLAHELYPDFQRLFLERIGNYEMIFPKLREPWINAARANAPIGYGGSTNPARCNTNVTAEFVDMFETKNGLLPVDDPTYDPKYPADNRDERLYSTVLLNGSSLWGRKVEFFEGGKDYRNSSSWGCYTGFTMNKHIDPNMSLVNPVRNSDNVFPILRLPEMYLAYAEAQNEYLGDDDNTLVHDAKMYELLNKLRTRGGLPALMTGELTRGEMREYIRRERTIELAFEDQRWHDLRRWRLAEEKLNGEIHGREIVIPSGGNADDAYYGDLFAVPIMERYFPERLYFSPIPQSEMDKNPSLVKNPGW